MNNKGRYKGNNQTENKFMSFMKESGFYIAIVIGLCALAAGAVYFSTNQILTDPDSNPYQAEIDIPDEGFDLGFGDSGAEQAERSPFEDLTDQSSIADNGTNYSEDNPLIGMEDFTEGPEGLDIESSGDEDIYNSNETSATEEEPSISTGSSTDAKQGTQSNADVAELEEDQATEDVVLAIAGPAFQVPVAGKIQNEYSMDKLVFSPTFSEWRTHSGVDIAAPRGEVVRTIGNGTITEIKNDPRYGFTIVIDHKNGYKSIYSNLATDQTMQVGQEIKMGDPIGAIGATAIFESAEPTHLHFELYKEDKLVDPAAYIDFDK